MLNSIIALTLAGHLNTEIGGIGAVISHDGGVVRVIKNSPADFCGLQKKDVILEADNKKGVSKMLGEPYTFCHLKIRRANEIIEKDIIRFGMQEIYNKPINKLNIHTEDE